MRRAAELAGLPLGVTEKRYLLGMLPVADGFLAWSRALPIRGNADWPPMLVFGGRIPALLYTALGLLVLLGRPAVDAIRRRSAYDGPP